MFPLAGDVLAECPGCTWWVYANELDEGSQVCVLCRLSNRVCSSSAPTPAGL